RSKRDWSSDVCSSDLAPGFPVDYPQTPPEWTGDPFEPPVPQEPEHGPLPVLDGEIVRNAVVRDDTANGYANSSAWSVQQDLQPRSEERRVGRGSDRAS